MFTLLGKLTRRLRNIVNYATEDDLQLCFRHILEREPDEEGWASWSRSIKGGRLGLRDLWKSFIDSAEAKALQFKKAPVSCGRFCCVKACGFRIYVDSGDCLIGALIAATGSHEPQVTTFLQGLLRPRATFLDLGANIGFFSLLAASRVGPEGRVIAFEPRPDNVALFTLSIRENGFQNIDLHPLAVAESEQMFMGYLAVDSSLSHVVEEARPITRPVSAYRVQAVALDSFLTDLPRLDFIKMDIDGNELRALRGMREILRRHQPVIVFEFAPALLADVGGIEPAELLQELIAQDYDLFILGESRKGIQDVAGVLEAFSSCGSSHLDLVAYPKGCKACQGDLL
jgi:FkbM family methyltransferase